MGPVLDAVQVPILFPLSDRQLWQLARVLTPRNFAKGETVFRQGDVADKFYICRKGAFSCFTSESRHCQCLVYIAADVRRKATSEPLLLLCRWANLIALAVALPAQFSSAGNLQCDVRRGCNRSAPLPKII
jgi:hypothetical protein